MSDTEEATARKLAFILAGTDYGTFILNRYDFNNAEGRVYGVGIELLETGRYEVDLGRAGMQLMQLLQHYRGPDIVVVDGGAHVGVHSIPWGRLLYGRGKLYAFEPQRWLYYALCGNIALNNLFNLEPRWEALSDKDGQMGVPRLNYREPASYGSLELEPDANVEFIGQSVDYSNSDWVPMRTIDSLKLERLDLLKLDIEGMEPRALRGAEATIRQHKPVIILEVVKDRAGEIPQWAGAQDYVLLGFGVMNAIAIHSGDPVLSHFKPANQQG
jgi:FkbM family methyltransferase